MNPLQQYKDEVRGLRPLVASSCPTGASDPPGCLVSVLPQENRQEQPLCFSEHPEE